MKTAGLAILIALAAGCSPEPPKAKAPSKSPSAPAAAAAPALTKSALRKRLEEAGGVLQEPGGWRRATPWDIVVDSLEKSVRQVDEKTWSLSDPQVKLGFKRVELVKRPEGQTPLQVFMDTERQNPNRPTNEWFFAPRPEKASSGTLFLDIEAPEPLAECRVKLAGCIIQGHEQTIEGMIEVQVHPEEGEPKVLYSIDRVSNTDYHDITPLVRGKRKFRLSAHMETALNVFGTYARIMQSTATSREVFAVRGVILAPDAEANRLWAEAARD